MNRLKSRNNKGTRSDPRNILIGRMKCAEFHKTYRDPEFHKEHKNLPAKNPRRFQTKSDLLPLRETTMCDCKTCLMIHWP